MKYMQKGQGNTAKDLVTDVEGKWNSSRYIYNCKEDAKYYLQRD